MKLSHIEKLESESIHIIREVVAEFENPVMLYSIGKDSSVMLHLAQKAFAPNKIPFKLSTKPVYVRSCIKMKTDKFILYFYNG